MTKKGIFESVIPPGFYYYNNCLYEITRVSLKAQFLEINGVNQGLLTNDNLTVYLSAVVNYRIVDPFLATFAVDNMTKIMDDISSGILKRIMGRNKIEEIVNDPYDISTQFKKELNNAMSPAGVKIIFAGIYQFGIPSSMVQSMAQSAISRREADAKRVIAQGEVESSKLLKKTAEIMNENKSSINLKYFETLRSISENNNTTILLPDKMIYFPEDF